LKELGVKSEAMDHGQAERLLRALAPFGPHIAEELWSRLGHRESIAYAAWPQADERYLVRDKVSYVIQVNGKVRGRVRVAEGSEREAVKDAARSEVASQLAGKEIVKVVFVPGRLVNFVVKWIECAGVANIEEDRRAEGREILRQLDRDALAVSARAYVRCDFMREGGERVDLAGVVAWTQVGQDGLLGAGLVRNAGGVTDAEVLLLACLLGVLRKKHGFQERDIHALEQATEVLAG
jgi:hypothetical protein